ncbi:MAG TPA: choice-of-anchor Q domain-containing protein [Acidimicrobiia bacterium]|jgi:hypothetical protein
MNVRSLFCAGGAAALLVVGCVTMGTEATGASRPASRPAAAITITVTTTSDSGSCPSSTHCSLRDAVELADANPGADTILVPAGTYNFTIAKPFVVTDSVTITKTGSGAQATVDAQGPTTGVRVLDIVDDAAVTTNNIGLNDGKQMHADSDGKLRGGGVMVEKGASLTMNGGTVSNNTLPGSAPDFGGGIYVAGQLTLNRVSVADNVAGGAGSSDSGGGIYGDIGSITITDSSLFGNQTSIGGAIAATGSLQLDRSAVGGNDGFISGGGISVQDCGEANITNSTIADNASNSGVAGGIAMTNGEARLASTTIVDNTAGMRGGGIVAHQTNANCPTGGFLHDTIVARNTDNTRGHTGTLSPDCLDANGLTPLFTSQGYNIIGDSVGCGLTASTGDHFGTKTSPFSPGVASTAAFNGGRIATLATYAVTNGGTSMDAGDPAANACGATDERGAPRMLGGRCDIGAYEYVTCDGVVVDRVGTNGNDSSSSGYMAPTAGADGILGLGGNDTLSGGGGNDALCGGSGNDHLDGGAGHDRCDGGPGNDSATNCESKVSVP